MSKKQASTTLQSLQDRVARIYYTHGLFCSTHPVPVIAFAGFIILLCCYPFINLPFPGNVPQEHATPFNVYHLPTEQLEAERNLNGSFEPRWYHGNPVGYVQQIVVRTAISQWNENLIVMDAFKAPLSKAFDIVEKIQNYQRSTENGSTTLGDLCLHVSEATAKHVKNYLPAYGCLIVSPANVWSRDFQKFIDDPDVISTVFALMGNAADPSSALPDILFGVPWKETSIKKFYYRKKPRVISYAVTIIFSKYDPSFIQGLEESLHRSYPFLHHNESVANGNITHVHFHGQYSLVEFIPLIFTYFLLFMYIYFSVRKIEMVKSKLGMAFSAVVTVIASLCMSVGLCTWFGLSFTIKAGQVYLKDIFPYLVVIIGLENILVLTKSVVSTPVNLDVKVRLAQGLSKEGWSITKNLVTELSILTFGFFTFVPAIQEFCFFAVVGLLSDFFLQLVFFATILAVDIGRMEMSDLHRQSRSQSGQMDEELVHMYPLFQWPLISRWHRQEYKTRLSSGNSPITLVGSSSENPMYTSGVVSSSKATLGKVPKRLRVVYFWARLRIFQKAFMLGFIIWVAFIVYKSSVVVFSLDNSPEYTTERIPSVPVASHFQSPSPKNSGIVLPTTSPPMQETSSITASSLSSKIVNKETNKFEGMHNLRNKNYALWRYLLRDHWPTFFGYYNISLNGRYISILPPIKLSIPVAAEEAIHLRHSSEIEASARIQWTPKHDSDFADYSDDDSWSEEPPRLSRDSQAYYPSSPGEVMLTAILAIPSVIFLIYIMIVLYHCICSRNYAEWRSSWSHGDSESSGDIFTQLVIEAMPVVLEGHPQEVECLATDGNLVVSSCLAGEVRVWDSTSGECLSVIDRKRGIAQKQRPRSNKDIDMEAADDFPSDYESGSPPSRSDSFIDRHPKFLKPSPVAASYPCEADSCSSSVKSNFGKPSNWDSNHGSGDAFDLLPHGENVKHRKRRDLFKLQPDLGSTISTNFPTMYEKGTGSSGSGRPPKSPFKCNGETKPTDDGYDFGRFQIFYDEHMQLMAEEEDDLKQVHLQKNSGELSPNVAHSPSLNGNFSSAPKGDHDDSASVPLPSAVWCIDCQEGVIAIGCSDGKIEFWDFMTGALKYVYDDSTGQGVTGIRIYENKIIDVRISGSIDFLEVVPLLCTQAQSRTSISGVPNMHRRTHSHILAPGPNIEQENLAWEEGFCCQLIHTVRAHQQPITVLEVEGGKAVTGSQDHTLKVFRVDGTTCVATLHGHYGPITTLFIDKFSPMTAASGSQDGGVCLWDLQTGTCICRLRGHDGAVTALSYTASYVLSAGTDNKLFVWERFQGHLLNTINLQQSYCSNIIMLTDNLLLTGQQGSLGVWDIRLGDPVRVVRLGHTDDSVLVRQIQHVGHTIVCDYGRQLRVVRFPSIVEKVD